jgi:hypothetical protein
MSPLPIYCFRLIPCCICYQHPTHSHPVLHRISMSFSLCIFQAFSLLFLLLKNSLARSQHCVHVLYAAIVSMLSFWAFDVNRPPRFGRLQMTRLRHVVQNTFGSASMNVWTFNVQRWPTSIYESVNMGIGWVCRCSWRGWPHHQTLPRNLLIWVRLSCHRLNRCTDNDITSIGYVVRYVTLTNWIY